jgi:hypothetical protein
MIDQTLMIENDDELETFLKGHKCASFTSGMFILNEFLKIAHSVKRHPASSPLTIIEVFICKMGAKYVFFNTTFDFEMTLKEGVLSYDQNTLNLPTKTIELTQTQLLAKHPPLNMLNVAVLVPKKAKIVQMRSDPSTRTKHWQ